MDQNWLNAIFSTFWFCCKLNCSTVQSYLEVGERSGSKSLHQLRISPTLKHQSFKFLPPGHARKFKAKVMVQSTVEPKITKIGKLFHFICDKCVFEWNPAYLIVHFKGLNEINNFKKHDFHDIEPRIHQLSRYFSPKSKHGIKRKITN